ncbi:MAG: ribosome-associated translation inhibitor RaiA [Erysipelotrichaceae bacterium]|jgi:putative sigma-54 modulation protein|nr:ribosome-associated translation inhibitor RaiA [Erysipelotrichaceae bacterium]
MLDYKINGKNFDVTDSMENVLKKRLKKLEKFFKSDKEIHCRVLLSNTKTEGKVEITLFTPHVTLRAEEKQKDLYAAFDEAVDKLIGQIRKLKTQNDRSQNRLSLSETILVEQEQNTKDTFDIEVIRNKEIELNPMTLEEAILRMDALGHSFFIYLDQESNRLAVTYHRHDGGYGVIEVTNRLI